MLGAVLLAGAISSSAEAQSGTVVFSASDEVAPPNLAFTGGPPLGFSSRILDGFGNTTVISGDARWFSTGYSGQGMVFGTSITTGRVLELRLEAGGGFDLMLDRALFGGYLNSARYVSYRLFSDDYLQSTALATVLTGTDTPAIANFLTNGWGGAIRLQFTETDASGNAIGRGPTDVGIQNIDYTTTNPDDPPTSVPEPGAVALLATGVGGLGLIARRRRYASA